MTSDTLATDHVRGVLASLHDHRLSPPTRQALVQAFQDDGIDDLEGAAEYLLHQLSHDTELRRARPSRVHMAPLARPTPPEVARRIRHGIPEVAFQLNGDLYDPQDISRFDGQALLFVPVTAAGGLSLQVFGEEVGAVLANYFQLRQIQTLLNPTDFNIPGVPPQNPPGTPPGFPPQGPPYVPLNPPGTPPNPNPGSNPPPVHHEPAPPVTWNQVQMFSDADYQGDWFWLARGYMWQDLTRVGRGGLFGGDWNDVVSSLSSTNTSCIYCEHIHLEGSKLFLGPNKPVPHLSALGWNDRISSVWNFD